MSLCGWEIPFLLSSDKFFCLTLRIGGHRLDRLPPHLASLYPPHSHPHPHPYGDGEEITHFTNATNCSHGEKEAKRNHHLCPTN